MAFESLSGLVGNGVLVPFRRGASDFVSGDGFEWLQSAILLILGVRARSRLGGGELPWRSDFGSVVHLLRHRPNDAVTAELARVHVAEALAKWLPQVRLKDVRTDKKKDATTGEETILLLVLRYDVAAQKNRATQVLVTDVVQEIPISLAA